MLPVYTKQRAGVFSFQQPMPPGINAEISTEQPRGRRKRLARATNTKKAAGFYPCGPFWALLPLRRTSRPVRLELEEVTYQSDHDWADYGSHHGK